MQKILFLKKKLAVETGNETRTGCILLGQCPIPQSVSLLFKEYTLELPYQVTLTKPWLHGYFYVPSSIGPHPTVKPVRSVTEGGAGLRHSSRGMIGGCMGKTSSQKRTLQPTIPDAWLVQWGLQPTIPDAWLVQWGFASAGLKDRVSSSWYGYKQG